MTVGGGVEENVIIELGQGGSKNEVALLHHSYSYPLSVSQPPYQCSSTDEAE